MYRYTHTHTHTHTHGFALDLRGALHRGKTYVFCVLLVVNDVKDEL